MAGERTLQQFIIKECKKHDTLCYKFSSPGRVGMPDLICVPLDRPVYFIEVKNPNGRGRISKVQVLVNKRINAQGTKAYVVSSKEQALEIITHGG